MVGSRKHTETTTLVRARRLREIGGRVINLLTQAVLLGQYRDTQCGLKAFRSDVAQLLFSKARIDGFAFDVELFHLVERYRLSLDRGPGHGRELRPGPRSTSCADALRLVRDLIRVRQGRGPRLVRAVDAGRARVPRSTGRAQSADAAALGWPPPWPHSTHVFKAYDVRGTVPDQLDADLCRAIGAAFARFALDEGGRCDRILVARDMRPSRRRARRRRSPTASRSPGRRRGRPRPRLHRPHVLRLGHAAMHPARCSPPRTTRRSTTASSSAWPAPRRSVRTPVSTASRSWPLLGVPPAADDRRAVEPGPARRVRRPRALVHRPVGPAPAEGRGRHRQRHGRPRRARGVRGPAVRPRDPVRRARRHVSRTTPPIPSSPRTSGRCGPGCERSAPTSGSRSTVTPTGCSWSTSRASGISGSTTTAMVAGGDPRQAARVHDPAQPDLLEGRARDRSGSTAAPRSAPGSATPSSRRSWPRPARRSVASTRRTTTSATTSAPTPGSSPSMHVLEQRCRAGVPLSELRKPFDRYADSGEINTEGRRSAPA